MNASAALLDRAASVRTRAETEGDVASLLTLSYCTVFVATARGDSGDLADQTVLTYLNRLSDAVYAMARFADEPDPELFEGRG